MALNFIDYTNVLQRLQERRALEQEAQSVVTPPGIAQRAGAEGERQAALMAALSPERPMFANDSMRNIAIATGAYDPSYISPLKRTEALAMEAGRIRDMGLDAARARALNPIDPGADDPHLLASQLAGDTTGQTQRVLHSLQGLNYENQVGLPPGQRVSLAPYRPATGIGGVPSEDSAYSRLDLDLLSDREFQKIAINDPARAAHVYQSLTGRSYENDVKVHDKIRARQSNAGMQMVWEEIKAGAHKDPATGKWMVWESREAPEGSVLGASAPRPYRQLVPASPEKQKLMDLHYSPATGLRMPTIPTATAGQIRGGEMASEDAEVAAIIAQKEREYGHALTPQEKMRIAYYFKNQEKPVSGIENVLNEAAGTASFYGDLLRRGAGKVGEALTAPLRNLRGIPSPYGP